MGDFSALEWPHFINVTQNISSHLWPEPYAFEQILDHSLNFERFPLLFFQEKIPNFHSVFNWSLVCQNFVTKSYLSQKVSGKTDPSLP